jgi:hypothetical protein
MFELPEEPQECQRKLSQHPCGIVSVAGGLLQLRSVEQYTSIHSKIKLKASNTSNE